MFQVLEWHLEEFVPKLKKSARYQSVFLSKLLHSQDLISNSPYLLSNSCYVVSPDNFLSDQVIIPLSKFLFDLITCLLDIVQILPRVIPSYSLMRVQWLTDYKNLWPLFRITCANSFLLTASIFSITGLPPTWAQKWHASITWVT